MAVPADLTGKTLWLRAKDLGAGGSAVTTWADQSGKADDATAATGTLTVAAASTPNGGKSVDFAAGGFTLPNALRLKAAWATSAFSTLVVTRLFDGSNTTEWNAANGTMPQSVTYRTATAQTVTAYTLTGSNDVTKSPTAWTFYGSTDGDTWTVLDSQSGITPWTARESKVFSFSNSNAYSWYRFTFTAKGAGAEVALSEIRHNAATVTLAGECEAELWLVVKSDGASASESWDFGGGTSSHYPYISSDIYEDFGSSARRNFTPTVAVTDWRVYRVRAEGTNWTAYLDNVSQATISGNTIQWTPAMKLGVAFSGNIAEALVVSRPLTETEVADLITYFNTEHGLTVPGGSTPGALEGTVAATSGVEGAISATVALGGTVAAVSGVEGAFESSGTVHPFAGQVDAVTGVEGSLSARVALAGQVDAVSGVQGSISVTGAALVLAEIPVGVTVETGPLTVASTVALAGTEVPVGLGLDTGATRPIVPLAGVTVPLGLSLVGRAATSQPADPRTGAPQWRYVVTDRDGTPLGELPDIEHDPVDDGVNEPGTMQLRIATSDPARALIKPIERQCEVWEGDRLLLRGPILNGRTSEDGQTVTHQVHDPSWWWRGGRRVVGRIPMLNLLKNGDFTKGLTYWSRGFDADSIPAAKPTVTIVDEDFANDSDGLDPIKAAQIVGVESVTITETELQSSAVYWPNRPFEWEPLAAGFRPEGPAAIDAVANAMPATAGLKVTIVGHTANDGTGSGMALSLRRAEAAKARVQAIRPSAVITTRGVGFYEPNPAYPIDSQQQRRVVISYESTTTITAQSKQWIRQTITVTQPKSARYPLELTAAAMLKVADDWSVEDANMTAIKVVARRQGTTAPWDERLGVGSTSISDTDPVDRWIGESASATIPADGRTYLVDVYLYAAAALTRYTAVGLFPAELLYFWGVDQALIVQGGVEHMQDAAMGHGPLGVTTRTPLTGIKRDRVYPHRDRMPMETFFDEWPSLAGGMDIDVLTTRTQTTVATFYPRQGQVIDYALVQGGNVVGATPATTDDVGSSIIAQAQDLGSFRREAYARDESAFDGLLPERVITAEQETPLNELGEIARAELGWAKVSTPSYWLEIHPERAGEVKAQVEKGDTVRLVLDFPDQVDTLARVVHRKNHPSGYRLLVALEEA